MGKIKKLVSKVNPIAGKLLGGDKPAAQGGGPEAAAIAEASAAQVAAQNEANRIAAETARNQQELANMNKNYAADLSTENRAMVEAGGSASDASVENPDQRRRRASTGLASTLGINV